MIYSYIANTKAITNHYKHHEYIYHHPLTLLPLSLCSIHPQHKDPEAGRQGDNLVSPAPVRRDVYSHSNSSSNVHHTSSNKHRYFSSRDIATTHATDSDEVYGRGGVWRPSRSNRYKSWDVTGHAHESFSAYTKLITTPGFGAQRRHLSYSTEELR